MSERWKMTLRDKTAGTTRYHGVLLGPPTHEQQAAFDQWAAERYGAEVEMIAEPEPPGEAAWWDAFFADLAAFKAAYPDQ